MLDARELGARMDCVRQVLIDVRTATAASAAGCAAMNFRTVDLPSLPTGPTGSPRFDASGDPSATCLSPTAMRSDPVFPCIGKLPRRGPFTDGRVLSFPGLKVGHENQFRTDCAERVHVPRLPARTVRRRGRSALHAKRNADQCAAAGGKSDRHH